MNPDTLVSFLNIGLVLILIGSIAGFIAILYFIFNFKSIQKKALEERERILHKQQQNRDDSGKRFESYRKHLDEFKNKPIL